MDDERFTILNKVFGHIPCPDIFCRGEIELNKETYTCNKEGCETNFKTPDEYFEIAEKNKIARDVDTRYLISKIFPGLEKIF